MEVQNDDSTIEPTTEFGNELNDNMGDEYIEDEHFYGFNEIGKNSDDIQVRVANAVSNIEAVK